jgi:hypothetical protein
MRLPAGIDTVRVLHRGITWAVRGALLVGAVGAFAASHWPVLFVTLLTFALTFLPNALERTRLLHLPVEFELGIILFAYASLFLGDVHEYYTKFWWWDIVLHGGSALALGFAGFAIVYLLVQGERVRASPALSALLAFCFALAFGALWEIVEFTVDGTFGTNMQKSGLLDTMGDLIVDAVSALIAALLGYRYLKGKKPHIVDRIVRRIAERNPNWLRPNA